MFKVEKDRCYLVVGGQIKLCAKGDQVDLSEHHAEVYLQRGTVSKIKQSKKKQELEQ